MSRHKTRKAQVSTTPVNNIAPAKASTAGKAEGVETISGGSNRWISPVITTAKIREIEDSALLQEPIQNLINLIFRGPAQVTVYDPAGNTDDALSEQAARRYQDLDLYTAHQQAFYDGLLGGCGVFSPGYDEMEKKDVFRHMPWYSFSKRPTMFSDTYNEIMPGITVDKSTRKVRVFQVQDDAMLEPIEIQNFAIIRDPTGPAPAGKPMCLPVVPIVWNYNYAIKVIQQKLNRVGAPIVIPLADITVKNKTLWEDFVKKWGKDQAFVLPSGTEFADMKIVENRVAEEYVAWLKKQATDYWNPATFVQKDGNSIGSSDSGAMELIYNYIDRTLSWVENGITKATQNFLLNGDWLDDGGYLERGYRVEIKHTRPSVSKDAAILAEVAELAKNGAITVNEMRQSLPNTDLGELTPEEEQALQDRITARQPQNPFTLAGNTPTGDYQGIGNLNQPTVFRIDLAPGIKANIGDTVTGTIGGVLAQGRLISKISLDKATVDCVTFNVGNVQTPAQRTEVMSDTERALIEATRKCAADVKRIAKEKVDAQKPGILQTIKNVFAPVNNASEEGTWVTINGAHILIKDGESVGDAFKRTTGENISPKWEATPDNPTDGGYLKLGDKKIWTPSNETGRETIKRLTGEDMLPGENVGQAYERITGKTITQKPKPPLPNNPHEYAGPTEYKGNPVKTVPSYKIRPPNEIQTTGNEKYAKIKESMDKSGWQGRPLVVIEEGDTYYGLTGSHRLRAARDSRLDEVPVIVVPSSKLSESKYQRIVGGGGNEDYVLTGLRNAGLGKYAKLVEEDLK